MQLKKVVSKVVSYEAVFYLLVVTLLAALVITARNDSCQRQRIRDFGPLLSAQQPFEKTTIADGRYQVANAKYYRHSQFSSDETILILMIKQPSRQGYFHYYLRNVQVVFDSKRYKHPTLVARTSGHQQLLKFYTPNHEIKHLNPKQPPLSAQGITCHPPHLGLFLFLQLLNNLINRDKAGFFLLTEFKLNAILRQSSSTNNQTDRNTNQISII